MSREQAVAIKLFMFLKPGYDVDTSVININFQLSFCWSNHKAQYSVYPIFYHLNQCQYKFSLEQLFSHQPKL